MPKSKKTYAKSHATSNEKTLPGGGRHSGERDALTGLLSRTGFNRAARSLIDTYPDEEFFLVYGDIDRFKAYNDLYGIEEGDHLLAAIGAMIASKLPERSVAAHLRADHFIVCLPVRTFEADRFLTGLDAWFATYPADFTFFVRLGIYRIVDRTLDVVLMSDRALLALREAKSGTGRSKYAYYNERLRDSLLKEQELAGELEGAIERGEFTLFFQPQYRRSSGKLDGAEVLVRWQHPRRGLLTPDEFIPVFERNGLISQLDYHVWRETARFLRELLDERSADTVPGLAVNLSRADLDCEDLCDYLESLVQEFDIPFRLLHLEITESAYMEAPERLIGVVNRLREIGFAVAMDDFGSGFSSLNTLKDVPVDILKLDMRFLDARNNTRGGIILASIVRMARWLELPVIAEGVETQAQADYLAGIGCDLMQGYLFSKPVDRETFLKLLDKRVLVGAYAGEEGAPGNEQPDDIWDANSHFALLFNRFVGAAAIAEYTPADERLEIVRANDSFHQLFAAELQHYDRYGVNMLDSLTPEDRTAFLEDLERVTTVGGDREREFRMSAADGSNKWLRIHVRALSNAVGLSTVFLRFEETTAQQALRDRFRATIDSVPGGVAFLELDDDGVHLIDFSEATATALGCTREEYAQFIGHDARRVVLPDDLPILQASIDEVRGGADRSACVIRTRLVKGGYRWVHLSSAVMYRDVRSVCVATVVIDVTREREAQRQLQERSAMQQRLCEAIPCGIIRYTVDEPRRLVSLNQAGCALLGCKNFDEYYAMIGGDVFSPLDDEGRRDQIRIIEQLQQGAPSPIAFTYTARRRDGSEVHISGLSALAEWEDGQLIVQSAFNGIEVS